VFDVATVVAQLMLFTWLMTFYTEWVEVPKLV
jgi:hypothetical protein